MPPSRMTELPRVVRVMEVDPSLPLYQRSGVSVTVLLPTWVAVPDTATSIGLSASTENRRHIPEASPAGRVSVIALAGLAAGGAGASPRPAKMPTPAAATRVAAAAPIAQVARRREGVVRGADGVVSAP